MATNIFFPLAISLVFVYLVFRGMIFAGKKLLSSQHVRPYFELDYKPEKLKLSLNLKRFFSWSVQVSPEKGTAGGSIKLDFPVKSALIVSIFCLLLSLFLRPITQFIIPGIFLFFVLYYFRRWYSSLRAIRTIKYTSGAMNESLELKENLMEITEYAEFFQRAVAIVIDGILSAIGTVLFVAMLFGDAVKEEIPFLFFLLFEWLYFALMESSVLQATLGKMAMKIKVAGLEGNRISFGKATARYFGKLLSTSLVFIGYIMAAFTEKKQALHDILAGTIVVKRV